MGNVIGFEGTIEGVERMPSGPQLIIKPYTISGKIPLNVWVIPAPDIILRANTLWSGQIRKGGDYVAIANTLLKGKKVAFYIRD